VCPGNVASLRSGDISVHYLLLLSLASMLPPHSVVSAQNNLANVIYASTGPQESTRLQGGWQEPMQSSNSSSSTKHCVAESSNAYVRSAKCRLLVTF
jgi:hypothetical protein